MITYKEQKWLIKEKYFNFVKFMQNLFSHIESLLKSHDFVIVPGFGGFVAETTGATEIDGTLYPPHKSIGFNPSLSYNDGLLAQQYVREYGFTFDEATDHIAGIVVRIKESLNQWRHLRFGNLGMFHLTESGVQFEPSLTNNLLSSSYGLVPIYFPIIKLSLSSPMSHNETLTIATETKGVRFTKRETQSTLGYKIVTAVAIILLLLVFPLSLYDGKSTTPQALEQASLIPNIDTVEQQKASPVTVDLATLPGNDMTYHVIIGSFYSRNKALQYLDELPSGYKEECEIVNSEHRYRVSYKRFGTESECDSFLETFTTSNPRFSDAWILELKIEN